jgi:hypothetical protein
VIVAHVFLAPYTLPVPFWLYLYGCAAALVLSFALLAYLGTSTFGAYAGQERLALAWPLATPVWRLMLGTIRIAALAVLGLTIAAGWWGPADPAANVGMTLFWVWFLLAFAYLTVLIGDVYALINPWDTLASGLARIGVEVDRQRVTYPRTASYWPAFAMYLALVWIELFTLPKPATLALALTGYTAVTLAGIVLFGRRVWLRHGDLFGVLFRVIGTLAPVEYVEGADRHSPHVLLRAPLSGAIRARADHVSLVLFILFMLSSTTYDTLHETYLWVSLYWQQLLPVIRPLWGGDILAAQSVLTVGYWWYQWLGLILSPGFYLLCYLAVLHATRTTARAAIPIRRLSEAFAFSLVPIAVAYHATHYVPSMIMQLPALLPQLADPFFRGWRLFPAPPVTPSLLPMGVVWHAQVFVLLAGHVAAVYVAHVAALRLFPTERQGVASQLPMLALMVGYTCLGLWALSLPIGLPQIVPAPG